MESRNVKKLLLGCLALLLASCMATPQTAELNATLPSEAKSLVILERVPFFPQEAYQCGPAALATLLKFEGEEVTPGQLVDDVYAPGRNGSFQFEMLAAARARGKLAYQIAPSLADLLREVEAGNPVLVLQNLGLSMRPQWHFAVVKGYDLRNESIILNSGEIENYRMSLGTFERTWARAEHWAVVALSPGKIPETATAERYFQSLADLQHSYPNQELLVSAFEAGVAKWPWNKQLLLALGNLHLAAGRYSTAATVYSGAVDAYPNYPPALNNLAHTLMLLGQSERALIYADRAVAEAGTFESTYQETYNEIVASLKEDSE